MTRETEITQALCVSLAIGLLEMCREMEPNKKTAKANRLAASIDHIMKRTASYMPGVCDPSIAAIADRTFSAVVQVIQLGTQEALDSSK